MTTAIACASGGYRVAFIQGVLSALENAGLRAGAYAGTSAAVIPAGLAAVGYLNAVGFRYAKSMLDYKSLGRGMSGVALESIAVMGPLLCEKLFQPGMPRFCVPVSAVITAEAAEQTQGKSARRLGRNLLLAAARRDRSWADANLKSELFDTHAENPALRLTAANFDEVAYASTRMLHAWDVPAWIDGRVYIDGSYTCSCPAVEMADMGYDEVIAIATDPGPFYRDLFATGEIPESWNGRLIHVIRPELHPSELGADFTQAAEAGLFVLYQHGEAKGREFLARR